MLVHPRRNKRNRTAKLRARAQNVSRDIDDDRPWPSAAGPVKALCDHVWQFFNRSDQTTPFGERKSHAKNIGLLKGVGADEMRADLSGYADDGNGIHFGVGNA